MRPLKLQLHGFGIFSIPTEVNFADVELFALTGPTGSGKTTILDGICFALYGAVPRHGEGAVAPIVNQQMNEATVGLTFALGESTYSVARRVRRSGRGATTGDASLERGSEVLATGAGQVTDAVKDLLGLDFRQFTTCVLLPQGEFARFLNEPPRKRQDLLGALLDLGLYDRIAALATGRAKEADGKLTVLTQRLTELDRITGTDLEALSTRKKELEELASRLAQSVSRLEELRRDSQTAQVALAGATAQYRLLVGLEAPAGWKEVGARGEKLATRRIAAAAELEAATKLSDDLGLLVLPARTEIERFLKLRAEQTAETGSRAKLTRDLVARQELVAGLISEVAAAEAALEAEIASDRAAHLRASLKVGDLCPVCGETITKISKSPKGLLASRKREFEQARKKVTAASEDLLALQTTTRRSEDRLADIATELEGVAADEDLARQLEGIATHQAALAAARDRLATARSGLEEIAAETAAIGARLHEVRQVLTSTWPRLTPLEPPLLDLSEPVAAWEQLLAWRDQRVPVMTEQNETAKARVDAIELELVAVESSLQTELSAAGLPTATALARESVVSALTEVVTQIRRVEEAREEAERKAAERDAVGGERDVAKKLVSELAANRFKKWIFDEIFLALVNGANLRLADLTSGQYELAVTNNDFEVIDHFAADNRRGVKSLSGGETFLVSLALAVALADEVGANARSQVALDSFFLDEGFGTLDSESLEVVARVISDLGAAGKTIGIVTHTEELAEQMPVRYEVRRVGNAATVTQVGL